MIPAVSDIRVIVRARCIQSLAYFARQAWIYAEPADPLEWSWHMQVLCDHFQALIEGRIRDHRLIVNIPPGHSKSLIASVILPAWIWTWWPEYRMIYASYGESLAVRDSKRTRWILDSSWYRDLFMRDWGLKKDSNAQDNFANTRSGFRLATSVGGRSPGQRANLILIDDPHKPEEIESSAIRKATIEWYVGTMSNRLSDMRTGAIALIMQRLYYNDLSAYLYGLGGHWDRVVMQSEFTKPYPPTSLGWIDPRTRPGELLDPVRYTAAVLAAERHLKGHRYSGQYQQEPQSSEETLFKRDYWRYWTYPNPRVRRVRPEGCNQDLPYELDIASLESITISLDATFKVTESGSFVVIQAWGAKGADRFLLDQDRARMGFTDTCTALARMVVKWPQAGVKLIEGKANGDAILDSMRSKISGLLAVEPRGGKEARASAIHPQVRSGNVYLPEHELSTWLPKFIEECEQFPVGPYDDQVDAMSQALDCMSQNNIDELIALCRMGGRI